MMHVHVLYLKTILFLDNLFTSCIFFVLIYVFALSLQGSFCYWPNTAYSLRVKRRELYVLFYYRKKENILYQNLWICRQAYIYSGCGPLVQGAGEQAKRLMLQCINGVSSNPIEGRTKICQLIDLILTLVGLIIRRIHTYIYIYMYIYEHVDICLYS